MSYPKELTALKQWICWRLEPDAKGGRPNKTPYDPHTGRKASSTNPATWGTLAEAEAACAKCLYTGVGFVFTKGGGIVGVDIDHCRDAKTGALNDTATAILASAATYTEISPSGEGLHLFLRGELPEGGNKNTKNGVEMYGHSRYFTMTGNRLANTPDAIAEDSAALRWIHETYVQAQKKPARKSRKRGGQPVPLSDDEVLEKAAMTDKGDLFAALMAGDWQGRYASQSEADMALCCKLAFWTGKNREQMDRLFRQSKLYRDKWDKPHHANGATYGEETLDRAMELVADVFSTTGDAPIFEYEGRYFRAKADSVYPLTNFVIEPVEMIVAEEETQLTADLVTVRGESYRQTFMTADFTNLQRFKGILNRRTIALSYTGTEGDLELFKGYVSGLDWQRKTGVKALGLYAHGGRWVYVSAGGAIEAGGKLVEDIIQLEKYRSIQSDLLAVRPLTAEQLMQLGKLLLSYNEAPKTVGVLAWCAGCFVKEHMKASGVKYPHLFLIGEAGSGKSNTLERVILPIFCRTRVGASTQVTAFTLMRESSSSNLVPQPLDEFKPSKIDRVRLANLYNHMRDSYDGHEGVRGRVDQSTVAYALTAPLIVAGEESPDEAAIRERGIELLFTKKDLKSAACRSAFQQLCAKSDELNRFGRGLLDAALCTERKEVTAWHNAGLTQFGGELPARIVNNLACCAVGLRLVDKLCLRLGLPWEQVFGIPLDSCWEHLLYTVHEYLLDGGTVNKGVIEQTLEVMARMGLDSQEEWCLMENGTQVAICFNKVYDRFTKYRRDHAIGGECLDYRQFLKQLRNSDLFIAYKPVRIQGALHKAFVLDYAEILARCDLDGFENTDVVPLN